MAPPLQELILTNYCFCTKFLWEVGFLPPISIQWFIMPFASQFDTPNQFPPPSPNIPILRVWIRSCGHSPSAAVVRGQMLPTAQNGIMEKSFDEPKFDVAGWNGQLLCCIENNGRSDTTDCLICPIVCLSNWPIARSFWHTWLDLSDWNDMNVNAWRVYDRSAPTRSP